MLGVDVFRLSFERKKLFARRLRLRAICVEFFLEVFELRHCGDVLFALAFFLRA